MNPMILHACAAVKMVGFTDSVNCRNLCETANHNEKRTIGAKAAMPTPLRCDSNHS